jgi:hypothetical protein
MDGDAWRVNFSRVEWQVLSENGGYAKLMLPDTEEPLPEDNWVWSPQGLVAMHYPEMWGYVQFSTMTAGAGTSAVAADPELGARAALMELYYAERTYHGRLGEYAGDVASLGLESRSDLRLVAHHARKDFSWPPEIHVTPNAFEASIVTGSGKRLHVSHDGHLW